MYEFTTGLASLQPPRPEELMLFRSLAASQADVDRSFGLLTGALPRGPDDWPELDRHLDRHTGRPPRRQPIPRGRIGVAVLALLVAAAGSLAAIRAFQRPVPRPLVTPPAQQTTVPSASQAVPSASSIPPAEKGVFGAMLGAVRASSPPGWQFDLGGDRLDGDWRLDGHVDDGAGPGRLYVVVTIRSGMIEEHPCSDAEFRQGGQCVERRLDDGDLLVLRDIVRDPGGMKTIEVVRVHPDGSGTSAEAGNWTIDPLPGDSQISPRDLPQPTVTRAEPLYTVDALGRLVRAVDRMSRECIATRCS